MNNPLEAVTQAVNSLVTALKLPDESAKANEVLGEMSFPQFSRLLPYRDYNQESGLFMNDTTMGFMLEAIPINGANESIVEALDHMLRTKLPRGIPLCIHLMSSQLVGDRIEYGLREFSWSGEQAERFNAITRAYYMKAAATQFPLPEGMNLPLTLRHYRVFISYCSPSKKKSRADILEMENLVKIIRASLQGASITTQTVDAQAFIDIVGEMINHNPDSLYPKRRQLDPYSDLNYQCVEDSFDLKVRADYLTLGLRENGRNSTARILNFHLARNPEIAFLWNVADNYSNLLNPELSISCPFILTLTLVVEDQVKTHSEANLKYMDLEKKSKTSYAKWFPSVEKEAKEWGELRQRLGSGQSSVVSYFLNITAFCKDNNETALEVEQDILNSFRKNGFELISPRFNHMRNFLTCLPFMAGKGLFKQLKEAGVVQRAESFNVANLMPLVADNPLTPAGLLAPTYRNQLAFIDIFFRGMNNTNYNMAVCGTSGAGKTGLIQPLIRSVLDSGGFAVVFDMGDGYKSLCENMGGVYLDGETLRFNPFANITDIDQSAERVRDQLSVMASPNGNLDEVHEGLLLQAVRASWLAKENRARIDDVVDFLKNASDSEQYAESPTIRSRLDEMIVLLDQYTANGTYGQYFNSDEPSLRDDAKMVVLELGGLEDRPSLLVAVMFSLIIYIENRMYRTPRNLKNRSYSKLVDTLLSIKIEKLRTYLRNSPAANLVEEKIEKTAISIRAVLTNYVKAIRYLQGIEHNGEPFTIRDWMRGVREDQKNGWLFISSNADTHASLKPVISMWLSIAIRGLLAMGENRNRRVWFFCDELPTLHKLPDLVEILPEARKFGGCYVFGIQSYAQLEDIYGEKAAASLFDVMNTRAFFRSPSHKIAEFAAGEIGEKEHLKASEQYSYGADPVRDGVSTGKDMERQTLVSYSDIQSLPDLTCYVTLPGPYPAVKLSLKYQTRPKVAPEFIPRDINPEMENRLSAVLAAREAEGRQMASLFEPDVPEVVSGEDVTQAEQPQQPVSPAINDKKSDSGVNVPAGGIEQELKMKPEEEMEQQLPPGISESGEVVDMAAYEAWQQENHPDIQQQMQRREEVNINVHRERGEDVEPGDDF